MSFYGRQSLKDFSAPLFKDGLGTQITRGERTERMTTTRVFQRLVLYKSCLSVTSLTCLGPRIFCPNRGLFSERQEPQEFRDTEQIPCEKLTNFF